jgi:hypothetical protein
MQRSRKRAEPRYTLAEIKLSRKLDISESEKQAAFRARRFAPDRTTAYSIEERLIDLAGQIAATIQ